MSAPAPAAPQSDPRRDNSRVIRSPTGPDLHTENWQIEAVYRMMRNNLDPDVAEKPEELVVYGGIGRSARHWQCFDQIPTDLGWEERRGGEAIVTTVNDRGGRKE